MEETKKPVEITSKEEMEKMLNTINEAEKACTEDPDSKIDFTKVKEVLSSLEGCTAHTVVATISTAFILLYAGAIMATLDIGKEAFAAKALMQLKDMIQSKEDNEETTEE